MKALDSLRDNILKVYFGDPAAVDRLLICVLARGHVLIEAVPGVGKTILATTMARSLDCKISRIQLTPDLLPSDIVGVTVWEQQSSQFVFKPGPVFCNILLADEINRTTPRTQSALLEAMNEAQVTVDGHTYELEQPFLVIATQNPYEFEGTYVLPESQVDRFLMRIRLDYPDPAREAAVLKAEPARNVLNKITAVMPAAELVALQEKVHDVDIEQTLLDYIVRLAAWTRDHNDIQVGVSTRGALMLSVAARATALYNDRDYCVPDDIIDNVVPVCGHRIITRAYAHDGHGVAAEKILAQALREVPSPT